MTVNDVMIPFGDFPVVSKKMILKEALTEMDMANLGLVCIINDKKELIGIITDGDLRRKLLKVQKPFSSFLIDDVLIHSKRDPVTCSSNDDLKYVVEKMGRIQIWDLPVLDNEKKLIGLLHLHPAVKKLLE